MARLALPLAAKYGLRRPLAVFSQHVLLQARPATPSFGWSAALASSLPPAATVSWLDLLVKLSQEDLETSKALQQRFRVLLNRALARPRANRGFSLGRTAEQLHPTTTALLRDAMQQVASRYGVGMGSPSATTAAL